MSFIEEVVKNLGLDLNLSPIPFRVVMFGNIAAYVEGVKNIKSYKKEEVLVTVNGGELKITGTELTIKKYCGKDLTVFGKIDAVTRGEDVK